MNEDSADSFRSFMRRRFLGYVGTTVAGGLHYAIAWIILPPESAAKFLAIAMAIEWAPKIVAYVVAIPIVGAVGSGKIAAFADRSRMFLCAVMAVVGFFSIKLESVALFFALAVGMGCLQALNAMSNAAYEFMTNLHVGSDADARARTGKLFAVDNLASLSLLGVSFILAKALPAMAFPFLYGVAGCFYWLAG